MSELPQSILLQLVLSEQQEKMQLCLCTCRQQQRTHLDTERVYRDRQADQQIPEEPHPPETEHKIKSNMHLLLRSHHLSIKALCARLSTLNQQQREIPLIGCSAQSQCTRRETGNASSERAPSSVCMPTLKQLFLEWSLVEGCVSGQSSRSCCTHQTDVEAVQHTIKCPNYRNSD